MRIRTCMGAHLVSFFSLFQAHTVCPLCKCWLGKCALLVYFPSVRRQPVRSWVGRATMKRPAPAALCMQELRAGCVRSSTVFCLQIIEYSCACTTIKASFGRRFQVKHPELGLLFHKTTAAVAHWRYGKLTAAEAVAQCLAVCNLNSYLSHRSPTPNRPKCLSA